MPKITNSILVLVFSLFCFSQSICQTPTSMDENEIDKSSSRQLSPPQALSNCNDALEVISQISIGPSNCMAAYSQTDLAQSFIATTTAVSGSRLYHANCEDVGGSIVPVNAEINIALYDNLPNLGGTLLGSGSSFGDGANIFVDVCWSDVVVSIGNTYYLVFTNPDGNAPAVAGDTNNPYPDGQTYANAGYGSFVSYDYTFEVFGEAVAPPAVPTLSQWGLMVLGLIIVIFGIVAIRQKQIQLT